MRSCPTRDLKIDDSNIKLKQMNMIKIKYLTASIGLLATSAQMASAASIALANASFEDDDIAANTSNQSPPTGWIAGINDGHYIVDGSTFPGISGGHSGAQYYLAANGQAQAIRQDTSLNWLDLSAGDTLTIGAWTTFRNDAPTLPDADIAYFWINDGEAAGGLGIHSGMAAPSGGGFNVTADGLLGGGEALAAGVWTQREWTYTVTQDHLDNAINNNWGEVSVQIGFAGSSGSRQIAFDDITLDYNAVPEPSGLALCGAGLGIMLLRRKRHA